MFETSDIVTEHLDSEPLIDSFILAPRLVQDRRTKEQFILAGADGGSIAFWRAEYVVPSALIASGITNVCTLGCMLGYFYQVLKWPTFGGNPSPLGPRPSQAGLD